MLIALGGENSLSNSLVRSGGDRPTVVLAAPRHQHEDDARDLVGERHHGQIELVFDRLEHAYGLKRMVADGFNENGEIVVPDCVRGALRSLVGQIDALDQAIGAIDRELAASVKADETAKRLMTIPGVGPVTASAIVATIQDAGVFASGREFAAFLGLTPRQNSTGGKTRLGRITKVGDRYPQRLAESSGNYDELYKARNEMWNET